VDVNWDYFPLSMFEVDCDGSACGSGNVQAHVHPPQSGYGAMARVTVRRGRRAGYSQAQGITRLVTL
jgi:hypothetical protein